MKVEFLVLPNGRIPAQEYLESLTVKERAKLTRAIQALKEYGVVLRMPFSEYLQDGIFQLRAAVDKKQMRILYFFVEGNRAILMNGFHKTSRQTPKKELEKGKNYRREYLEGKR